MINSAVEMERSAECREIAIVRITRQQYRNAFNDDVVSGLARAADQLREQTDVRCVIVTGAGGFFSAGADLSLFDAIRNEFDVNKVRRLVEKGGLMCAAWEKLPQLTIAAIDGGAVGGGLGLALSCDWRVMAEDAWIYVPEARLGLNYGWNTLPRLNALVGPARTKTISILCRKHGAKECVDWGIADRIGSQSSAMESAIELAREVCTIPRLAAQIIKRSVNANAYAMAAATSYADMDDMLVCMTDQEGKRSAQQVVNEIKRKKI